MSAARNLVRAWRRSRSSAPLLNLTQGSTLTIKSSLLRPLRVRIHPGWRDDGLAELEHRTGGGEEEGVEMDVRDEGPMETSLGRMEPHVSLHLRPSSLSSSSPTATKVSDITTPGQSPALDPAAYDDEGGEGGEEEEIRTVLNVRVPEKVNLVCDLRSGGGWGGPITVTGKVEGDVRFATVDADISVTKLRGHEIDLSTRGTNSSSAATIHARDKLEAERVSISATNGRVRVKQLLGRSVRIAVDHSEEEEHQRVNGDDMHAPPSPPAANKPAAIQDDEDDEGSLVDLGALFVSGAAGATIDVALGSSGRLPRRAVRVKSHHGPLEVLLTTRGAAAATPSEKSPITDRPYPLVELGGVNGNCEVTVKGDSSSAVVAAGDDGDDDRPDCDDEEEWESCLVHFDSLSPDSVSLITVDRGNTAITMDRKVETDVRLLSASSAECLTEAGALLAEEEDPDLVVDVLRHLPRQEGPSIIINDENTIGGRRLVIETASFTHRSQSITTDDVQYVDGWVENKSAEPDSRFDHSRKNRNRLGGGKIRLDGAAEQALKSFSKGGEGEDRDRPSRDGNGADADSDGRPLVAVASTGRISLETVSWIGAIARRYGLEESKRGETVGRTASRKGRPFVSPRDNS